jgi:hypothetical protein
MIDTKVEKFLESNNINYMFLMLANLEVTRLTNLPDHIKKNFDKKITELALLHVAKNEIPDYIIEDYAMSTEDNETE